MVLEMKVPHGATLEAVMPIAPVLLSYVVSFVYVGIYWNHHHHMLHAARKVNGAVLWANLHLLFWLSLLPFATGWMGENHFAALPSAFYGGVLFAAGLAFVLLKRTLLVLEGPDSLLHRSVGYWKGNLSMALYLTAIASTFWLPWVAQIIYVGVALLWVVPDRRIEKTLESAEHR